MASGTRRSKLNQPMRVLRKLRRDIGMVYDPNSPESMRINAFFSSGKKLLIGGAGPLVMM